MKVYMDNAATTRVLDEAIEAMLPFMKEKYGNASSLHAMGSEADEALADFRKRLARLINAEPEEIVFTSGATESNNLAIWGAAFARPDKKHFITSAIEHSAVLNPMHRLEKLGRRISVLGVDREGFVDVGDVEKAIGPQTNLVSIIHANHEIGTIQNITEIGKICREKGVLFHTDSAQGFTKVPIDVKKMNVDLLTLNSHKIHGPKGVGALYVREGVMLEKVYDGGPQERNLRPGTENLPGIAGFVTAAEIGVRDMEKNNARIRKMRDKLVEGLLTIPHTQLNGPKGANLHRRLPGNANITFKYIEGEALMMNLSLEGIYVSTGSACSSRSLTPSHVLKAIGLKHEEAHGSIRFSLSKFNNEDEIPFVVEKTKKAVERLRKITAFVPQIHSEIESAHPVTFYRERESPAEEA
ncbi:MAG: IscS subfamily cysteine desulfurase [Candidatus Micrarchaeia archaeon]